MAKQAMDRGDSLCDAVLMAGASGQPSTILASIDSSGRRFCNTIARIRIADKPSMLWQTGAWNAEPVSSIIKDVDGDGILELVVPQPFTNYEGARACVATLPVIYQCSGDTCSDVSRSFGSFYAEELDNLGARITSAENARIGDTASAALPCLTMERDKLRRMLGIDRLAGLQQAEAWMGSSDLFLRRKAVVVFADINDTVARQKLKTLANDPDRGVASAARRALEEK